PRTRGSRRGRLGGDCRSTDGTGGANRTLEIVIFLITGVAPMKGLLAAVSAGALLAAPPAWAQNTAAESRALSQQDKAFIQAAGAGNLAEAEMGQLAEQKATTPAIKEFGRWMATDHGFANKWLAAILREERENFQPALTTEQTEMKRKLEGLSGV